MRSLFSRPYSGGYNPPSTQRRGVFTPTTTSPRLNEASVAGQASSQVRTPGGTDAPAGDVSDVSVADPSAAPSVDLGPLGKVGITDVVGQIMGPVGVVSNFSEAMSQLGFQYGVVGGPVAPQVNTPMFDAVVEKGKVADRASDIASMQSDLNDVSQQANANVAAAQMDNQAGMANAKSVAAAANDAQAAQNDVAANAGDPVGQAQSEADASTSSSTSDSGSDTGSASTGGPGDAGSTGASGPGGGSGAPGADGAGSGGSDGGNGGGTGGPGGDGGNGGGTGSGDGGSSGSGPGGDAGGGGRVICTELYHQGHMTYEQRQRDIKHWYGTLTETHFAGYHFWAVPVVRALRKGRWVRFWSHVANRRSNQIAYVVGDRKYPDPLGWIYKVVIENGCWLLGAMGFNKDYKQLYNKKDA